MREYGKPCAVLCIDEFLWVVIVGVGMGIGLWKRRRIDKYAHRKML